LGWRVDKRSRPLLPRGAPATFQVCITAASDAKDGREPDARSAGSAEEAALAEEVLAALASETEAEEADEASVEEELEEEEEVAEQLAQGFDPTAFLDGLPDWSRWDETQSVTIRGHQVSSKAI
jgi:hypothetical protein